MGVSEFGQPCLIVLLLQNPSVFGIPWGSMATDPVRDELGLVEELEIAEALADPEFRASLDEVLEYEARGEQPPGRPLIEVARELGIRLDPEP
jgi:hypothetical protein